MMYLNAFLRNYRTLFVAITVVVAATAVFGAQRKWIVFRDKGPGTEAGVLPAVLRDSALNLLTPRALARRAKVLPADALVDVRDLPVYHVYLDSIRARGITIISLSRWNNSASAMLTDAQDSALRALDFVDSVGAVRRFIISGRDIETPEPIEGAFGKSSYNPLPQTIEYGGSFAQMHLSGLDKMHALGVTGTGVLLGMLDNGFRWKIHDGMRDARVIGEYDFIFRDSSAANDSLDIPDQDLHGTWTFSLICSWNPGIMIGGAFNASYMLSKTEDDRSETHVEEDNYEEALEWMEAAGVDITSSSLGYSVFDSGQVNYTVRDMNGRTTICAKAVERAARLGVCVVTAAGNSGGTASWPYVETPGDADTAITCGAVDSNGVLARFSSRGPTADGRIKPDVCAMGVNVMGANADDPSGYNRGAGTSFATPITAASAACLLSAFPALTPVQVRDALRAAGDHAARPDTAYGWGVFNVYKAALATGVVISNPPRVTIIPSTGQHRVVAAIAAAEGINDSSVTLFYMRNHEKVLRFVPMQRLCFSDYFSGVLPDVNPGDVVDISIQAASTTGRTSRWNPTYAQEYEFHAGDTTAFRTAPIDYEDACAQLPASLALEQNYPNPFTGSTTIRVSSPAVRHATLEAYNTLGQKVATVYDGDIGGFQDLPWSAPQLPGGVYFLWLRAGTLSASVMVQKVE